MDQLNFGGLDPEFCQYGPSKYVVLPVPYDRTSTWGKGADQGPQALLEASLNMELYDIETHSEPYKKGIFTEKPLLVAELSPESLFEVVLAQANRYLADGKKVITIGGNHSVSVGSCKAHSEYYDNLSILQLDAHSDMRDSYQGSQFNHACVMARMRNWGKPVMVGIRSMDISEVELVKQHDVFYASYIRQQPNWIQEVVECLTDNVYLTIDLDGFDPSIMPATGTPEPGGLFWHETLQLLETVARQKNLIGFDVVELCPNPHSQPANFLAAKLVYKIIALMESYAYSTYERGKAHAV